MYRQQPLQQQRWPMKRRRQQPQVEEVEQEDRDTASVELDQYAGIMARGLITQGGLEDSTEMWRSLKQAYLVGYADVSH